MTISVAARATSASGVGRIDVRGLGLTVGRACGSRVRRTLGRSRCLGAASKRKGSWRKVAGLIQRTAANSSAWVSAGLHGHGAIHLLVAAMSRPSRHVVVVGVGKVGRSEVGQLVRKGAVPVIKITLRRLLIASAYLESVTCLWSENK
jgi:Zn-dependent alcohol dehydrogenase